jgi:hypothetical protein
MQIKEHLLIDNNLLFQFEFVCFSGRSSSDAHLRLRVDVPRRVSLRVAEVVDGKPSKSQHDLWKVSLLRKSHHLSFACVKASS